MIFVKKGIHPGPLSAALNICLQGRMFSDTVVQHVLPMNGCRHKLYFTKHSNKAKLEMNSKGDTAMKVFSKVASGIAAAGFLFSALPVAAQQQLTESEVRSFFQRAQQELTEVVNAGDLQRLRSLMQRHVADGARFMVAMELMEGDTRKALTMVWLDKDDMLRLQRIAFAAFDLGEALEDYSLEIEVAAVDLIGPNSATVTTRSSDAGTLRAPTDVTGALPEGAQARQQDGHAIRFERTLTCSHLVHKGPDQEELVVDITNCQGQVRM